MNGFLMKKTVKSKTTFKAYFLLILLIFVFIGIRLIQLPELVSFASDEGRDLLVARDILVNHKLTLTGPPSQYALEGRQFFFGPAPYYTILPALFLGNGDPLFVSYFLIMLHAAILLISLLILNRYIKGVSTNANNGMNLQQQYL